MILQNKKHANKRKMPQLTWRETGESDSDISQLLLYLLGTLLKQLQNVKSVVPPPILGVISAKLVISKVMGVSTEMNPLKMKTYEL